METIQEITKSGGTKIYSKGKFLGKVMFYTKKGGFAKCYEVTHDDKILAAKIISKASLTKARQRQKLMSEIKIHKSITNDNIVSFNHYFEDQDNVYILLELCTNQTMNELIRRRKRLTELETQCYLLQILNAIQYLHKNQIIHRDLKLGNLFLSDKMEIKVGDFGLATQLEYEGERRKTICGTPNYIAPEILESTTGHSFEVDIWSFGVIAYTLLIGKPPFETNDVKATYRRIKMNAYQFPDNIPISSAAKSLIQKILQTDPHKRPSIEEIQQHEFFASSIPSLLPLSTLACPPSSNFMRQYSKQQSSSSQIKFENTAKDVITKYSSQAELKVRPQNIYKSVDRLPMKPIPLDNPLNQNFMQEASLYVKKWVDYSSKYGLGYILQNHQCGVVFNDCTKIITYGDDFLYFDRNGIESQNSLINYPPEMMKKVTLLLHFKGFLIEQENEFKCSTSKIYVKKWMKSKHAIIFRLSDKTVQVVFTDNSQVILTQSLKIVTYIDKMNSRQTHLLSTALESDNVQMVKRLKYTKEILSQMLGQAK